MDYTIVIMPRAEKELRKLPRDVERRILTKIAGLESDLSGDVKRLTDREPAWRLRVGDYRVLFDVVGERVVIQTVKHRKDAYD